MQKTRITLFRYKYSTSLNTLGTDCVTAMGKIPDVSDIQIETETEDEMTISYRYTEKDKFDKIDEVLHTYGVTRIISEKA